MADENSFKGKKKISRRKFTGAVALVATTVAIPGSATKAQAETSNNPAQGTSADVEAQFQAVMKRAGGKLTNDEQADVKRLLAQAQKTSEALHNFPLENSDEPATVFRIYRSKPAAMAQSRSTTGRQK